MAKYASLRWDANTGTPGLMVKKGTLVKVVTSSNQRHLVEYVDGDQLIRVWVDSDDLTTPPRTRYDRLSDPNEDPLG
jgi:hypothetical protein